MSYRVESDEANSKDETSEVQLFNLKLFVSHYKPGEEAWDIDTPETKREIVANVAGVQALLRLLGLPATLALTAFVDTLFVCTQVDGLWEGAILHR